MRPGRKIIAAALCFSVLSAAAATGAQANPASLSVKMQQRVLLLKLQAEADEAIAHQMARVASWLRSYCQKMQRFPADSGELSFARNELTRLMPVNPYYPTALVSEPGAPKSTKPIVLEVNSAYGMTEEDIQKIEQQPPDDWQNPPGTITVTTNGQDLAFVWAASADRRPLRDPQDGKAIVVVVRCTAARR